MFRSNHTDVWGSLKPHFFKEHRPTVVVLIITPDGKGIVLAEHEKGPAHTFIPPQGEIKESESIGAAIFRVIDTELPGVQLDLDSYSILGDAVNELPPGRDDSDKWMFWVAARCNRLPAKVSNAEIKSIQQVRSSDHLTGFLETGQIRRKKREMLIEAVNVAHERLLLSWGYLEHMVPTVVADRMAHA